MTHCKHYALTASIAHPTAHCTPTAPHGSCCWPLLPTVAHGWGICLSPHPSLHSTAAPPHRRPIPPALPHHLRPPHTPALSSPPRTPAPSSPHGSPRPGRLSSGSNQNVAVTRSGDMYAWGFGEMGQLCNGKSADERSVSSASPRASACACACMCHMYLHPPTHAAVCLQARRRWRIDAGA